jgi:hypothetical protein
MKTGWFVSGRIAIKPAGGQADLRIPISGPKRSKTISLSHASTPVPGDWIPLSHHSDTSAARYKTKTIYRPL